MSGLGLFIAILLAIYALAGILMIGLAKAAKRGDRIRESYFLDTDDLSHAPESDALWSELDHADGGEQK